MYKKFIRNDITPFNALKDYKLIKQVRFVNFINIIRWLKI